MAKRDPQQSSDFYHANALNALKGMAWFAGLALFTFPYGKVVGFGLLALAAVFMVVGCVLYVFGHQARMLEAQDAVKALPKQAAAP